MPWVAHLDMPRLLQHVIVRGVERRAIDTLLRVSCLLAGRRLKVSYRFMDAIVSFAQNHVIIVILIVLGLIFLMVRNPKLFFSLLALGLILAGLFYLIMSMAGSGAEKKSKLIEEKEEQFDTNR